MLWMMAGIVPIGLAVAFWLRGGWSADTLRRHSTDMDMTFKAAGGAIAITGDFDYDAYWWGTGILTSLQMPEWEMELGNQVDPATRTWFGTGPYAGADFQWHTAYGSFGGSFCLPWYALTLLGGAWAWLMVRMAKRRRRQPQHAVDEK